MVAIGSPSTLLPALGPIGSGWFLERVSVDSPRTTQSLEFHPRLNVVVTSAEQVAETVERLSQILHAPTEGVHVEFSMRGGPSFVLFRPVGARSRLIDIEAQQERRLDMLAGFVPPSRPPTVAEPTHDSSTSQPAGSADPGSGHAAIRGPATGPVGGPLPARQVVASLAPVDQAVLWRAGERLLAARNPSTPRQVPSNGSRSAAGAAAPASSPRRGLLRRRPKGTGSPSPSQVLVEAEQHWRLCAGQIDLDTALCQRTRVEVASRLLMRMGALATVSHHGAEAAEKPAPNVEDVLGVVCALVPARETYAGPHVVAVPGDADPELASLLLDQLGNLDTDRQLIVVTSAERVIDWARLESHARRAALLSFDPA